MNNIKIAVLTQYYYPDSSATGRLMRDLAEDLAEKGAKVTVYTVKNNVDDDNKAGYNNLKIIKMRGGTKSKKNKFSYLWNFISLYFVYFLRLFELKKFDHIIFVSYPPILGFVAALAAKLFNIKLTFIVHEVYPDIAIQMGVTSRKSIMVKLVDNCYRQLKKYTSSYIAVGPLMKVYLHEAKKIPLEKIYEIPNWEDGQKIEFIEKKQPNIISNKYQLSNKFTVMYTGNLGIVHGVDLLLEVAKKLKEKDIMFALVGQGTEEEKLRKKVKEEQLNNIVFIPFQYYPNYNLLLQSADCFYTSIQRGSGPLVFPSKVASYLAAGRPIISITYENNDVNYYIQKNNSGYNIDLSSKSIEEICSAILFLYKSKNQLIELNNNARLTFEMFFERKKNTNKLINIINESICIERNEKKNKIRNKSND